MYLRMCKCALLLVIALVSCDWPCRFALECALAYTLLRVCVYAADQTDPFAAPVPTPEPTLLVPLLVEVLLLLNSNPDLNKANLPDPLHGKGHGP